MDRLVKRKSAPKTHDFKIGDKCILWHYYPYNGSIRTISKESSRYWILDTGEKFKKSDLNASGFTGYADYFIEPLTVENLKLFNVLSMRSSLVKCISESMDYDYLREVYRLAQHALPVPPYGVLLLDKFFESGSFESEEPDF